MSFTLIGRSRPQSTPQSSQWYQLKNRFLSRSFLKYSIKTLACTIFLTASSLSLADTHFGLGVSDGDRKVTWLGNNLSVSDELAMKSDYHWLEKEEATSDINYEAYLKSFKLYMVFKRKF